MDLLILVVVLLLAFAFVALILAKLGKARQAARTAQLYGQAPTYQQTFEDPAAHPIRDDAFPGPSADAAPVSGSPETEATETRERMARDLGELLKARRARRATFETTTGTNRQHPHQ